ncbi:MAG: NifB/NifX family molybdenum-iron cluster-binding protein [Anaerolineales bacterium]|nr:NifB/NifX family molybdenum-iron cluster-binding protein [Anaerolineales bacterium]
MKIILTAVEPNFEANVDPRFGRGAYFLVVDLDTLDWQSSPNPAVSASGGAGIQAAQFAAEQGCQAVLSGEFGPNAFNALKAAGIAMHQYGTCATVPEAIRAFKAGELKHVTQPDSPGRAHR